MQDSVIVHKIELAESGKAPTRFLLLKDGDVGWEGMKGVSLNAESAKAIIAEFDAHGSAIPIDYHHATEKVRPDLGGKAPAAGHIRKLEYVKGEGLFAVEVEWTAEGREDVEEKRFVYTSPAMLIDKESLQIVRVTSVALTNTPRTIDAKELLEAAERQTATGEKQMDWKATAELIAKKFRIELGDEHPVDAPALDAGAKAMNDVIQLLNARGAALDENASVMAVLQAVVVALSDGEDQETTTETAPEEAEAKAKAQAELEARASQSTTLKMQVVAMRGELDAIAAKDKAAGVEALLGDLVADNRLNPNDEKGMAVAKNFAELDLDRCRDVYATVPQYAPAKATTTFATTGSGTRKTILVAASREWEEKNMGRMVDREGWLNQELRERGLSKLTKTESEALV